MGFDIWLLLSLSCDHGSATKATHRLGARTQVWLLNVDCVWKIIISKVVTISKTVFTRLLSDNSRWLHGYRCWNSNSILRLVMQVFFILRHCENKRKRLKFIYLPTTNLFTYLLQTKLFCVCSFEL